MGIGNIDFGGWMSNAYGLPSSQWQLRAQITWSRILGKAKDVQFKRKGVFLPPQTVAVEYDDSMAGADSEVGMGAMRRVMLFGLHGHPTKPDLDVIVTDTFIDNDLEYTVMSVNRELIGEVQVYCEAVG